MILTEAHFCRCRRHLKGSLCSCCSHSCRCRAVCPVLQQLFCRSRTHLSHARRTPRCQNQTPTPGVEFWGRGRDRGERFYNVNTTETLSGLLWTQYITWVFFHTWKHEVMALEAVLPLSSRAGRHSVWRPRRLHEAPVCLPGVCTHH